MKKLLFSIVALMLLLAQCKKQQIVPESQDKVTPISITVSNGAKAGINGTTINWEKDDKLYVFDEDATCRAILACGESKTFTGSVSGTITSGNHTWRVIFAGKKGPVEGCDKGDAEMYYVNIGFNDQDGSFDNSFVAVEGIRFNYSGSGEISANCKLEPKVAVLKLDLNAFDGSNTIYVYCNDNDYVVNARLKVHTRNGDVCAYGGDFITINPKSYTDHFYLALPASNAENPVELRFSNGEQYSTITCREGLTAGHLYTNITVAAPTNEESDEMQKKLHPYVDLGGTVLWAKYNMGATSETDCGYYYAWGETEPYTTDGINWVEHPSHTTSIYFDNNKGYSMRNYYGGESFSEWNPVPYGNDKCLTDTYDAAHVEWGGDWIMPKSFKEIINANGVNMDWESADNVFVFTNRFTGNVLKFFGSGHYDGTSVINSTPQYWTSRHCDNANLPNKSNICEFKSDGSCSEYAAQRHNGYPIRPLIKLKNKDN